MLLYFNIVVVKKNSASLHWAVQILLVIWCALSNIWDDKYLGKASSMPSLETLNQEKRQEEKQKLMSWFL